MTEQNRRLLYSSIALLIITGTTTLWGDAIGMALFIEQVGLKWLPLAILLESLLSMVFILSFEQLKGYLHDGFLVGSVCLLGIGLLLIGWEGFIYGQAWGVSLFYATRRIMSDLLQIYSWNYVISYYTTQNRQQVPTIMMYSRLGMALGGLSLILLTFLIPLQQIIALWLVILLLSGAATAIHSDEFQGIPRVKSTRVIGILGGSITSKFSSALRSYLNSPMMRLLSIGVFCMRWSFIIMLFETLTVFSHVFQQDADLLRWLSFMNSFSSLLVVPVLYGLLPRLLRRASMEQVSNLYILLVGSTFIALQIIPNLATAIFGEVLRNSLLHSIYNPINNQMRNILPSSVRVWAHTFVAGLIEPLGRFVGGVVLVGLVWFDVPTGIVVALGGLVMLVFALSQYRAGDIYQAALDQSIEAGQYRYLRKSLAEQLTTNQDIVDELLTRLKTLDNADREVLLIAEALAESGSDQGFAELLSIWGRCTATLQAELVMLLVEGWPNQRGGQAIQTIVVEALESHESKLRNAALRVMLIYPHLTEPFRVAQYLIDADPSVSTLAAQILLQHPTQQLAHAAEAQLNWLAQGASATTRALAVHALVDGGVNRYGERIIRVDVSKFQQDTSARVRMAVVPAADLQQLVESAKDISPAVRQLAVQRLKQRRRVSFRLLKQAVAKAHIAQPQHYQIMYTLQYWHLLAALGTVNPKYGQQIMEDALRMGIKQVDFLSSLCLTLQGLHHPPFKAVVSQLQLDRTQLIQAILNFIGAVHGSDYISAITRTLQIQPSETARQEAYLTLANLISDPIAAKIDQLLAADRYTIQLVGDDPRWQPQKTQEAFKTLLSQQDDWFELLVVYAMCALSLSAFEDLADLNVLEAILQRSRQSHEDALREAARMLQQALHQKYKSLETDIPVNPAPRVWEKGDKMLSTIERMVFLRNVRFFENLRLDQLRALARICDELSVNEGEYIIHKGEAGDSLFIIVEGAIKITDFNPKGEEILIVVRGPGDVLGEISLFDGGLRSAGAVAGTPALLLVVNRDALYNALADDPGIAMDMLRAMAQLVRNVNQEIAQLTTQLTALQPNEIKGDWNAHIKPKLPPQTAENTASLEVTAAGASGTLTL